ncbi:MAG: DMT family transporter [Myxococcota bacterium]
MAPARWRIHAALLAVQVFFGLHPVAGAIALTKLNAPAIIGVRTIVGAPLLMLYAWMVQRDRPIVPAPGDRWRLAVLALLGVTVNQLLFTEGLHRAGAVNAAILVVTIPILTLLVAILLGREPLSGRRLLGVGLALVGAALITRVERFDLSSQVAVGDLMLIANSLCYAVYLVLAGPVLARVGPMAGVAWVFCFGALLGLPLTGPALLSTSWGALDGRSIAALAFIVAGPTLGAYGLNAYALRWADASVVAVYVALQPFIGAISAHFVLGAEISARTAAAGVIIVAGVLIASATRRRAH